MKKLTITISILLINIIIAVCQTKPMESDYTFPQNRSTINSELDLNYFNDSLSKKLNPYKIIKTNNVKFVRIQKNVSIPSNIVEIKLIVDKNKEYFNTIELSANSGLQILSREYIAFKDVVFPFKAQVKFHVTGQFIVTEFIDVEFLINETCGWTVEIFE